jgi:hypothetical protein
VARIESAVKPGGAQFLQFGNRRNTMSINENKITDNELDGVVGGTKPIVEFEDYLPAYLERVNIKVGDPGYAAAEKNGFNEWRTSTRATLAENIAELESR